MCGRARFSSDVSEVKLVFSIPPHRPTPDIAPSWNAVAREAISLPAATHDLGIMIVRERRTFGDRVCEARRSGEAAMRMILFSTLAVLIGAGTALAFPTDEVPTSEPAYLAKVKTAAPEQIVAKASIVMMQDGKSRSLQTGTNGFTCQISEDGTPLCADENGMAWMNAVASKSDPPNGIGFIYVLAGDTGTGDNDPDRRAAHLDWVQTGPHLMIVGPNAREMLCHPINVDVPDPTQPYVMFAGTPYEHLMLPLTAAE